MKKGVWWMKDGDKYESFVLQSKTETKLLVKKNGKPFSVERCDKLNLMRTKKPSEL